MKDNRIIDYIFPTRIVEQNKVDNALNLLNEQDLQIGLFQNEVVNIKSGGHIILDFKYEMMGGIRILTFWNIGARASYPIRIRFGESVTETCVELNEKGACNDHSVRDMNVSLVPLSDQEFGLTGFRFVRIDNLGELDLPLKAIVAKSIYKDLKEINSPTFKDKRIQEIYDTCKRTLLLNIQHHIWDGIKRDRLVWIGDMEPEIHAILHVYGHIKEIDASIDFAVANNPIPGWMNGIPSYSLWFLLIIYDVYMFDKNSSFLNKYLQYMNKIIAQFNQAVDKDGKLNYLNVKGAESDSYFIDWPSSSEEEIDKVNANVNLMKYILTRVKKMYEMENIDTSLINSILIRLEKVEIRIPKNKAFLAFYYLVKQDDKIYQGLIQDGAKGMSTFISYYVLKAVSLKDKEMALKMMKEYYGAMLDRGATTFFEDFSLDWLEGSSRIDEFPKPGEKDLHGDYGDYCYKGFRHSLCHGWSSGPISLLIEDYLDK